MGRTGNIILAGALIIGPSVLVAGAHHLARTYESSRIAQIPGNVELVDEILDYSPHLATASLDNRIEIRNDLRRFEKSLYGETNEKTTAQELAIRSEIYRAWQGLLIEQTPEQIAQIQDILTVYRAYIQSDEYHQLHGPQNFGERVKGTLAGMLDD